MFMYLMYVDESGDTGLIGSKSPYYVLSGVILHELCWRKILDRLIRFRRGIKGKFGLNMREEIHASEFISFPSSALMKFNAQDRLAIIRHLIDEVAGIKELSIITVIVNKTTKPPGYDVFENAWQALIQRLENTLKFANFSGPKNSDDRGMIFPDNTSLRKLTRLMRKMRFHNYVLRTAGQGGGARNLPLEAVIEDPNQRDSKDSYLIQVADITAYFAHQLVKPNRYVKSKGAHNYYKRLKPVLCMVASSGDPLGLVRL